MITPTEFILKNWKNTYRFRPSPTAVLKVPKPFTVPCIKNGFNNFFYWDTYFTNIGLLLSGETEQAKNNLENIAYCIQTHGFMPNADSIPDRSQPPLFARGVNELYRKMGDHSIPAHFVWTIEKELLFWEKERTHQYGLSFYGFDKDETFAERFFHAIKIRVGLDTSEREKAVYEGRNLLAIAESGWDFTHRFTTRKSPIDAQSFAPVDLNCILFEAERICAELFLKTGEKERAEKYFAASEKRKALIERFMKCEDGVYRDYNVAEGKPSSFTSCASFLPFVVGISSDGAALAKLLEKVERPYGVAAGERVENGYQWDFPNTWPPLTYFAVTAAENCGEEETAKRLARKYIGTVERVFKRTGQLWEKYDAETGDIPEKSEYGTPPMMGWTAGVYLYLIEKYEK